MVFAFLVMGYVLESAVTGFFAVVVMSHNGLDWIQVLFFASRCTITIRDGTAKLSKTRKLRRSVKSTARSAKVARRVWGHAPPENVFCTRSKIMHFCAI